MSRKRRSALPDHIAKRLPEPEQRREKKVTARFTDEEFEILEMLSEERNEKVASFVRSLVVATLREVKDELKRAEKE